jgi:hypothetical protein
MKSGMIFYYLENYLKSAFNTPYNEPIPYEMCSMKKAMRMLGASLIIFFSLAMSIENITSKLAYSTAGKSQIVLKAIEIGKHRNSASDMR